MLSHQIAFYIHSERQRDIERRLRLRSIDRGQMRNRSIRRRLGQALIQFGSVLAPETPSALASRH